MCRSTYVLSIPEVTMIICEHVAGLHPSSIANDALFNLAQVNKMISEIALDLLWRTVDSVEPFSHLGSLYCIVPRSEELIQYRTMYQYVTEYPSPILRDVANGVNAYQRYLTRVKYLIGINHSQRVHGFTVPNTQSIWTGEKLLFLIPMLHLREATDERSLVMFPNLIEAWVSQGVRSTDFLAFSNLLGGSLRSLYIRDVGSKSFGMYEFLLTQIPHWFPKLRSLGLRATRYNVQEQWLSPLVPRLARLTTLSLTMSFSELHIFLTSHVPNGLTTLKLEPMKAYRWDELTGILQALTELLNNGSLVYFSSLSIVENESGTLSNELLAPQLPIMESYLKAISSPRRAVCCLKLELYTNLAFNFSDEELSRIGNVLKGAIETLVLSPRPFVFPAGSRSFSSVDGLRSLVAQCPNLVTCGLNLETYSSTNSAPSPQSIVASTRLQNLTLGSIHTVTEGERETIRGWFPKLDRLECIVCEV